MSVDPADAVTESLIGMFEQETVAFFGSLSCNNFREYEEEHSEEKVVRDEMYGSAKTFYLGMLWGANMATEALTEGEAEGKEVMECKSIVEHHSDQIEATIDERFDQEKKNSLIEMVEDGKFDEVL